MKLATLRVLRQYMDDYMAKWPFSGTILVARKGELLFREAYGHASLEHDVPNRPETKFGIWSITKSFTALSVAMLAEEGKLKLDDELSRYIPELAAAPRITILQAMNHVSGLVNFTNMPEYNGGLNKKPVSKEETLRLLLSKPMDFEPGAQFAYNNTGYFLLGLVIEAASGMAFDAFIASRILQPLGLSRTGVNDGRSLIPDLASAYHASENGPIPMEFIEMSTVFSAGGMYSTIDDLHAWAQSFDTAKLVSRSTLEQAFAKEGAPYGLGWFLDEKHGRRRIHHGGAYRGFRTELHRYPDEETTIIVLTNYDFVPATKLADALSALVFGEESVVPEFPQPMP
ncbi:serine hydrolase domain-containing protein [Paenibacillus sp. LHD-117]|uniref:serine hydrolase domain-containing protein n=1 Tax=Paenibacillus sp. LHD-117 TaxID=3071412 RepID=UPI0027E1F89A|nr:serine hydrolase domain-containing protein [Paenibacillus sp. LHD-117]MDQ6418146.1 serine hydrolase domain-containing protein [Paenibacillus sp. LHD-117]